MVRIGRDHRVLCLVIALPVLVGGHLLLARSVVALFSFQSEGPQPGDNDERSARAQEPGSVRDRFPLGSTPPEYDLTHAVMTAPTCPQLTVRRQSMGEKRFDIVAIGDSYTFGVGVPSDRTWPALLGKRLGAEVLNLGVPGFNLQQKVQVYEQCLPGIDADMVLLQLLLDDTFSRETVAREHWPAYVRYGSVVGRFESWSSLYPPFYGSYYVMQALGYPSDDFLVYRQSGSRLYFAGYLFWKMYLHAPDRSSIVDEQLERLVSLQQAGKLSRLVILLVPYKEEVWWDKILKLSDQAEEFAPQEFGESVLKSCARLDLECYDAAEHLRSRREEGLYFRMDDHPNVRGHTAIADWVARIVSQQPK